MRLVRLLPTVLSLLLYSLLLLRLGHRAGRSDWRHVQPYAASCTSSDDVGVEWREAEYAAQISTRRVADLHQRVRAKSPLATQKKRAAYASSAGRDELKTLLRLAEQERSRLQRRADSLLASAPSRPLLTQLPRSRVRSVNVSFVLQYYNKPQNVLPIVQRLYSCTHGRLGSGGSLAPGLTSELVVHVDNRGDAAAWDDALNATSAGSFMSVRSPLSARSLS